jgi:hypothetical protein
MRKALMLAIAVVTMAGCSRSNRTADGTDSRAAVEAAGNTAAAPAGQTSPAPEPVPAAQATQPPPAANGGPQEDRSSAIPAGTPLRVRLAQTIDTKHWRSGQSFRADLDAAVMVNGRVIVPRGTEFRGHVVESKPSGRLKGRAYLGLALDSFRMGGRTYSIHTAADVRASRSHKKRNLAFIGGGSGGGAAIGAIAGGGVGALIGAGAGAAAGTTTAYVTGRKQVTLRVETPMVFKLRGRVQIEG